MIVLLPLSPVCLSFFLFLLACPQPVYLIHVMFVGGNTPLHIAAGFGQFDVMGPLLDAGADPLQQNNASHAALDLNPELRALRRA